VLSYLEPTLRHGRAGWDRDLLPSDELEVRGQLVRDLLGSLDASAAVIVADTYEPGAISWLNTYEPTTRWALLLMDRAEHSLLVAGLGGGRDHHHIRDVSAVRDVTFFRDPGTGVAATFAEWGISPGRVATVGFDTSLPLRDADAMQGALSARGWSVVAIDAEYAALRRAPRPRELAVLARAQRLLDAAAASARADIVGSGRPDDLGALALAVERRARAAGFHDVRAVGGDGRTGLVPLGATQIVSVPSGLLVAGEYLGVWAEVALTVAPSGKPPVRDAASLLTAALERCAPGARLEPGNGPWDDGATEGVLSRRRGRSLDEGVMGEALAPGDVVFVCAWRRDGDGSLVLTAATVLVGTDGSRALVQVA